MMRAMKIRSLLLLAALTCALIHPAWAEDKPRVNIVTQFGTIEVELTPALAPQTVANFLALVDNQFYDGLVFHRVIANFMIQGGGYNTSMTYKPAPDTVPNESFNGVRNRKGTIAMARLSDPDSADSQFFINVKDNTHLDGNGDQPGYTVFGQVVSGYDVVEQIELVDTHLSHGMAAVPEEPVVIKTIQRVE
jgi:cyclophilin family peptidyl-prolyl cis-trans isomerase